MILADVTVTIVMSVIAGIGTILSIIFAILAFGRNKIKDNTDLEARITKLEIASQEVNSTEMQVRLANIEKDIQYIRESLTDFKEWRETYDKKLHDLETDINNLKHDHDNNK